MLAGKVSGTFRKPIASRFQALMTIILKTAVDRFDAVDTPQGFRPSSLLPISPLGEAATYPMARQAT